MDHHFDPTLFIIQCEIYTVFRGEVEKKVGGNGMLGEGNGWTVLVL